MDVRGNLQFTRGCIAQRLKRLKWHEIVVLGFEIEAADVDMFPRTLAHCVMD